MSELHADAELIDSLGGPAKLARTLGYSKVGGVQRVQNWKRRGIPEVIRLRRADLFGPAPIPTPSEARAAA